ncbi:conserved hypothetical protein [Gluconacetobacter diazotrophicus PA1 5]|uniref:Uncharacterized protein n=2 Tax=Gluconacetobacter diazotrophicus TaxID=33996 RepID=A0A7W4I3Z8_GLUDI|nr:hypothetical protein [Gluconacetobacter diazotrophicus]ACI52827.1 conserved hypothetical protein [Gluconacetobacter diazotrophicus PA1 5]MBB2155434.1 hypothetical protein [Gluconacetobacter diazotrophicus]TWB09028.1 hypothetical protein FBZ86_105134 [Gluconacetobacter diazotrophicus]CAP57211.1 putative membrane protein [Gluconacetobacter diazotrophicus PA1 5]
MPASEKPPVGKLVFLTLLILMTIGMGISLLHSEFTSIRSAGGPPVPAPQSAQPHG